MSGSQFKKLVCLNIKQTFIKKLIQTYYKLRIKVTQKYNLTKNYIQQLNIVLLVIVSPVKFLYIDQFFSNLYG